MSRKSSARGRRKSRPGGKPLAKSASVAVLLAYLLFVAAVRYLPCPPGGTLSPEALITCATLAFAAINFFLGAFPLELTALVIPVVLAASGVLSAGEAFRSFSDSTILVFGGMFVVGGAMFHTGLAERLGWLVLRRTGGRRARVTLAVMLLTAALSAVLSNTGTAAVLLPIVCAICDRAGWSRERLLYPMAVMCGAGGMITMVGTPPNIAVNSFLGQMGYRPFGFFEFGVIGIPMTLAALIYFLIREGVGAKEEAFPADLSGLGSDSGRPISGKQLVSGLALLGVVAVMATGAAALEVAALGGAALCVLTGTITKEEAYQSLDLGVLLLFAGALSLSVALDKSGTGALLARTLLELFQGRLTPRLLVTLLFAATNLLTQFMSNTACCALMAPISLEIALELGISPYPVLMTVAMASSAAFATPVATPLNTMIAGPAGISFRRFLRLGLPLNLAAYGIALWLIPLFWSF